MNKTLVLFEDEGFVDLLPLTFWQSVFELRVGRKIILDRTAQRLGLPVTGVWTRDWFAPVAAQRCGAPVNIAADENTVLINGRWLPRQPAVFTNQPCVGICKDQVAYIVCDRELASRLDSSVLLDPSRRAEALSDVPRREASGRIIQYPWDLVSRLSRVLEDDWRDSDATVDSEVDAKLLLEHSDKKHIGENTRIHPTAILDAAGGPIFISHDVQIGAFCSIEGPVYIGPGSVVHPYTRLYGGNAIGPVCKVAGEIHGCVISSYSNKQHAGYLGHSYVGSWANIGAGATNSDLKNTYGKIRVPINGREVDSDLQFLGAIIGDHAKIGINATIPTGAVIGLASSVATSQVLPKYIPSFSWVTSERISAGDPLRLLDAACAAMTRRDVDMTDEEVELFIDLGTRVRSFEASK